MKRATTGFAVTMAFGLAVQLAALAANLSPQDQKFIKEAAQGGMAEVMLGKMADEKGVHVEVRKFGEMMVNDHSRANKQLKELATEKGVRLPTEVGPQHKALAARLEKLSGSEFDRTYMQEMVKDHEKDVKEFQKEAESGRDVDIKKWASKTLPTLQMHLKMANETAAKLVN